MSVGWSRVPLAFVFVIAVPVQAAVVSYDVGFSNTLPDGPAYLRVTMDDEGAPDAINFHIDILDPLDRFKGKNFGIQSFGFNSDISLCDLQITGLPHKWKISDDRNMSEFGRFEVMLKAPGNARVESLEFSIAGVSLDDLSSYALPSSGNSGGFFFAAHVAGLSSSQFEHAGSAFFAGGTTPILLTPLPGAVWLLLAGLGILGITARRNSRHRA